MFNQSLKKRRQTPHFQLFYLPVNQERQERAIHSCSYSGE